MQVKYLETRLAMPSPCELHLSLHTEPVRSPPASTDLLYTALFTTKKKHQFPKFPSGPSALSLVANLRWPTASILIADYGRRVPRLFKA